MEEPTEDLVDANQEGKVQIDDQLRQTLAPELQSKSNEELEAHVAAMAEKREKIQAEIRSLQGQRLTWLAEQKKDSDSEGLGHAIIKAIKEQNMLAV